MQTAELTEAFVSANELFTPALVSLESCRFLRLDIYRIEIREEAVNVSSVRVCACVNMGVCVYLYMEEGLIHT